MVQDQRQPVAVLPFQHQERRSGVLGADHQNVTGIDAQLRNRVVGLVSESHLAGGRRFPEGYASGMTPATESREGSSR